MLRACENLIIEAVTRALESSFVASSIQHPFQPPHGFAHHAA
jgi:hypothetical protein